MNCIRVVYSTITRVTLALTCLLVAAAPAVPQEGAKPSIEKWRPKDGLYAGADKDFDSQCKEDGDIVIELAEKFISGFEWGCKIDKVTDIAPGAIKLNMTCHDINMPSSKNNPHPEELQYKEIMLMNRINGKSISVRKTFGGEFKYPSWRASYCPEDAQRMHMEAQAREQAEAKKKAIEEEAIKNPWHPQDGIYAIPGANFEDRCLKGGDATIDLTEKSISRGADKCSVTFPRVEPNSFQLFVTCRQEPAPPRPETIFLKRTAAKKNIIRMQMSRNREFSNPEEEMSYCGPDAQKQYALQKAKK